MASMIHVVSFPTVGSLECEKWLVPQGHHDRCYIIKTSWHNSRLLQRSKSCTMLVHKVTLEAVTRAYDFRRSYNTTSSVIILSITAAVSTVAVEEFNLVRQSDSFGVVFCGASHPNSDQTYASIHQRDTTTALRSNTDGISPRLEYCAVLLSLWPNVKALYG